MHSHTRDFCCDNCICRQSFILDSEVADLTDQLCLFLLMLELFPQIRIDLDPTPEIYQEKTQPNNREELNRQ